MTDIVNFPSTLQPDTFEIHVINNEQIAIPVIHLEFKKWKGLPIPNTFGGKGLIEYNGEPMFVELAVQRLAVSSGWDSRWVETYAMKNKTPYYFTEWGDGPLRTQAQNLINNQRVLDMLALIASYNNSSYSGCWDVVVWNDNKIIFIESKRVKKDRFRGTQDRWLNAGLRAGLPADDFAIVQWDFL
jgi:hypothetical protein